ncbi:thiamine-phosphate kinase [Xanthomonas arboricola]|uniref:Thiamine-monophosphate kinase n=2 Tax=Xanthomonas arboricola pv. pruni TaxID=69929 RepID=A0AAQ0W5Q7_9XANT|nr:thiamine-phosphate kinase [Xanthomonas arboricola]KCX00825.1 thiamine-monophosphate kinase [Xanthomonas arboricola pv. pruni]KPN05345.1 thiamine-monophosphate kinase [Xanthomonas arboricola pv. pruni]MDN0265963.1 thiamine-phosphate kinase [Xanthomonas arboricola pv. pruni]MDN0269846.1 thiamine-phosphate kinase [Xanthomonas arboricola pv. pruni]MDN0274141.1 thiamine-phosphate kinase [Xanthomonas arboricola pv. pruni]
MPEFDLIARLRARIAARADVPLGIGDDAALLQPPPGEQLAITADTLNAGVHFPHETRAEDLGWKTLAVNLSDLAAMGAQPRWCTLSLSLPHDDAAWVDAFADGFFALADAHDIALVGGDTTRGPLSCAVTAIGSLPPGAALRRDGARVGDDVWVTGAPGEAAAALSLWQAGQLDVTRAAADPLHELWRGRLLRPQPRVQAGLRLRGLAHACVDISDGLLADLGHLCERSGVGAQLALAALPAMPRSTGVSALQCIGWQLGGGDDYELCFTAAVQHRDAVAQAMDFAGVAVTRIGQIVATPGVVVHDADGNPWQPPQRGYQHFVG